MLCYLPPHLDDELYYSILARTLTDMGPVTSGRFLNLIGCDHITPLLTRALRRHASLIPSVWNVSAESLLEQHTVLPYFESTASPEASAGARSLMMDLGKPGVLPLDYSLNLTLKRGELSLLRFCPACVEEDRARVGAAAWKRCHNLPEVYVCHRHETELMNSEVPVGSIHEFVECPGMNHTPVSSPYPSELALSIAHGSAWLLQNAPAPRSRRNLKGALRLALQEQGWPSGSRLTSPAVSEQFVERYGKENLLRFGFKVVSGSFNLARELSLMYGIHPVRMIILLHSADRNVSDVLRTDATPSDRDIDRVMGLDTRERDIRPRRGQKRMDGGQLPKKGYRSGHGMLDDNASALGVMNARTRLERRTPPQRVTRTDLMLEVGITGMNTERQQRYPLTTAALRAATETTQAFKERKLAWLVEELIASDSEVSWPDFRATVGFHHTRVRAEEAFDHLNRQLAIRRIRPFRHPPV